MTLFDLRSLKLRAGEEHREAREIELAPIELAGQRYVAVPEKVEAELAVTQANSGNVFELRFHTRLH